MRQCKGTGCQNVVEDSKVLCKECLVVLGASAREYLEKNLHGSSSYSGQDCEVARTIISRSGDVCVSRSGEPTSLYYHIQACDECAHLRAIGRNIADQQLPDRPGL